MKNFEIVFPLLIKDEGIKFTITPGDNGGPTKYGITLGDVQKYIKKNATAQDVRNLTLDQAKNIYKFKYWDALGCDGLSPGVDYTCFDYGVNSGLGRPRKVLQRFKSLQGTALIDAINNERTTFLKDLAASQEHDRQFLTGWLNRVERVRSFSKQLAKKDNTSGAIVGGSVVVASTVATTHHTVMEYLHSHPITVVAGVAIAAIVIGTIVHFIRNKGK